MRQEWLGGLRCDPRLLDIPPLPIPTASTTTTLQFVIISKTAQHSTAQHSTALFGTRFKLRIWWRGGGVAVKR